MFRIRQSRGSSNLTFTRLTFFAKVALAVIAVVASSKPAIGQQVVGEKATSNSTKAERIPLTLVPRSALSVVSVRPKELLSRDVFRGVAEPISQIGDIKTALNMFSASVGDVQEVLLVVGPNEWIRVAIQFDTPQKCQRAIEGVLNSGRVPSMNKRLINGLATWRDNADEPSAQLTKLNELTIVLDSRRGMISKSTALADIENPTPAWAEEWVKLRDRQLVAAVQLDQALKTRMSEAGGGVFLSGGFPLQAGSPLIQDTRWAVTGIGLHDQAELDLVAECDSPDSARKVARTIQALMLLASNVVEEQEAAILADIAQSAEPKEVALKPAVKSAFKFASEFLNKAEPKDDGQRVQLAFTYPIDEAELAIATSVLRPVMTSASASAFRTRSSNNMKQLLLGFHNYASMHGRFAPASSFEYVDDAGQTKRSKHPHSWRIDMLPWIEQEELWKQYRFEEPWDSDANKKVLAAMPDTFRHPMDKADSTNTSYFAITGPETTFSGEAGAKFIEIRDGTANTILLVEAKRSVPWTKPEDIPYAKDKPLEKMGGWFETIFIAGFADGHTSVIPDAIEETALRARLTKNGGEKIRD